MQSLFAHRKSSRAIASQLSLAAVTLIAASEQSSAQSFNVESTSDWLVDTSVLSYRESDDRVSVAKVLANLSRSANEATVSVGLVNDTMSGASPTGALRGNDSAVTLTGASGSDGDLSRSTFDDERQQASVRYQQDPDSGLYMSYGALVSQESDYDSVGADLAVNRSGANRQKTYTLGLAYTHDTIYRSDTGGTPEPLSNNQNERSNGKGTRETIEAIAGYTQILNKLTFAQINATVGHSDGYHSDPYKVISAADDNDRIIANFHDSRPDTRLRLSVYSQLVHQMQDTKDSLRLSYRYYRDDWGIDSHTAALRYRHTFLKKHYVEPHVRFYAQSEADFYQRKLDVDAGQNPVLPDDGVVSADYRLDKMTSSTIGLSYGMSITPAAKLRLRAEYLDQRFSSAAYSTMSAVIVQTSFSYTF